MKRDKQDITEKAYLTPGEAILHYGLSVNKFYAAIKERGLPFVALYGGRRLVIRSEFEKYIRENPGEYRRLKRWRREETQSTVSSGAGNP